MEEKTADELAAVECHHPGLLPAVAAIILPLESDLAVLGREEPLVGDRHAMGVAAEIRQHLGRAAERRLGVDHPLGLPQRSQIGGEAGYVLERLQLPEELQLAPIEALFERFEKQTAEQAREHPHGKEEARPARDPALAIRGQAAAGNDAMHMRMMQQVLSPGAEHGEEADLRSQMLRIARDAEQRFGSGAEENAVEHRGVIKRDAGNLFGNGEDHVEVFHWQQFGLAAFQPFCPFRVLTLGAMAVAAGVIRDAREVALAAAFDMAA